MAGKLEYSFFCEATSQNMGKNNFYGVFDRFMAKQFPALHTSCCLVGRISAEPGKHALQIRFKREADGTDYLPKPLPNMEFVTLDGKKNDIIINLEPFPLFMGPHESILFVTAEWLIDEKLAGTTEFTITKVV